MKFDFKLRNFVELEFDKKYLKAINYYSNWFKDLKYSDWLLLKNFYLKVLPALIKPFFKDKKRFFVCLLCKNFKLDLFSSRSDLILHLIYHHCKMLPLRGCFLIPSFGSKSFFCFGCKSFFPTLYHYMLHEEQSLHCFYSAVLIISMYKFISSN